MISVRHRPLARLGLAVLASALVVLSTSVVPGAGAQAQSPSSSAESTQAGSVASAPTLAREPLRQWKCTKWRGSASSYERSCARLSSFNDKVKIDYRERFYNSGPGRGTLKCSHAETTTWTFDVSATVEAEVGVIFAKAKTSITAGVSRSSSTTRTTEVTYPHRPRTWAHCERGLHGYTFKGEVKRQICRPSGCRNTIKEFSGDAPEAGFWQYGSGRGGVEVFPRVSR